MMPNNVLRLYICCNVYCGNKLNNVSLEEIYQKECFALNNNRACIHFIYSLELIKYIKTTLCKWI